MNTSLAWLNLRHHKTRTLIAVTGVGFALILVFMQLGFLGAVRAGATLLYDRLDFDVVLVSRNYADLNHMGTAPRERLAQARAVANVAEVAPLYVGLNLWRNPLAEAGRRRRNIMIVGFAVSDGVFDHLPEVRDARLALQMPDTVLIDSRSRPEFGPRESGIETELGGHRVRIVGQFTIGTGFGADGMVIASDETFSRLLGGRSLAAMSLGLIQLKDKTQAATTAAELNRLLPPDVRAWTRQELASHELQYWTRSTSVGIIIFLGVFVALAVGMVFVYQVISSDIQDHLRQYATLKAMGFRRRYLSGVVLQQAVIIALAAFVPALLGAWGLYMLTRYYITIPIDMTLLRGVCVLALALGMCSLSGLLALRRVTRADPADLF
jgi:putative ABC transport system permease protein